MNSQDRRIVHMTLKEDKEIYTKSFGNGSLKKVLINIKGAGKKSRTAEKERVIRIRTEDTIAAISTSQGKAGIGIIRISGDLVKTIRNRILNLNYRKINKPRENFITGISSIRKTAL